MKQEMSHETAPMSMCVYKAFFFGFFKLIIAR